LITTGLEGHGADPGLHVGHQQCEAQAEVLPFLAQAERGGVVHQRGVAVLIGERSAAHAARLGAVGLEVHAVGGSSGKSEQRARRGGQDGEFAAMVRLGYRRFSSDGDIRFIHESLHTES
jgi:hypothetical protein